MTTTEAQLVNHPRSDGGTTPRVWKGWPFEDLQVPGLPDGTVLIHFSICLRAAPVASSLQWEGG